MRPALPRRTSEMVKATVRWAATVALRAAIAVLWAAPVVLWAAPAGAADLAWSPADPVDGDETVITLTDEGRPLAGAAILAVYQPESEVARTEEIGLTGADGSLAWTPVRAGVVALRADTVSADTMLIAATCNLTVRFRGVPWTGLLVMAVAGLVLYGGVVRGFRLLAEAPPALPPDT